MPKPCCLRPRERFSAALNRKMELSRAPALSLRMRSEMAIQPRGSLACTCMFVPEIPILLLVLFQNVEVGIPLSDFFTVYNPAADKHPSSGISVAKYHRPTLKIFRRMFVKLQKSKGKFKNHA